MDYSQYTAPKNINVTQRANEIFERKEIKEIFSSKKNAYQNAIMIALALDLTPHNFAGKLPTEYNIADTSAIFNNEEFRLDLILQMFGYTASDYIVGGMALAEAGLAYLDEKIQEGSNILKIVSGISLLEQTDL